MDETVDCGLKCNECTEIYDADDLAFNDGTDSIPFLCGFPRLGQKLLVAQGYLLICCIDFADDNFDLLTDFKDVSRVLDGPVPRALGNMEQTVNAADIYESAEIGEPADDAVPMLANLKLIPYRLLGFFCFLAENCLVRADDALALRVYFEDLDLHGLTDILIEVGNILVGDL